MPGMRAGRLAGRGVRLAHDFRGAFDLPGWLALSVALVCLVFAFGQSLMVGNMLTTSLGFLPATKADGNAVISTLQQLSGAIGTAVLTAVVNASQLGATDLAQATIAGTCGAYLLLSVVMVIALLDAAHVVLRLYHR